MYWYRLLFLAILLALAPCVRAQKAQLLAREAPQTPWELRQRWVERHELDGRFRLLAPAEMRHQTDSLETAIGTQVFHTFHVQAPDAKAENVIYALSYVDYPAGSIHHDSLALVADLLAGTEAEALRAVGGEIIYTADKTHGGYPARQWRIDYPSKGGTASARTLAIVADNRYYELKVFSRSERGVNASADKFFDSLRIFAADRKQ